MMITKAAIRLKHSGGILLLLGVFALLPTASAVPRRELLYVSFLDQLPPQGTGPAFNGLDERRRGVLFQKVLHEAVAAGGLRQVFVINANLHLPSNQSDEPPVPAGATLVRVYLTRWSDAPLGGFATSEVQCRLFAEVVRDGRTVAKLGPFLGRIPYSLTETTTFAGRNLVFRDAARAAVEEMARALPR